MRQEQKLEAMSARSRRRTSQWAACFLATGMVALAAAQPPPANDNCATATLMAGDGTFPFDTTAATGGVDLVVCPPGFAITEDVWYCWTAPRTGIVTISTCGQTNVNTHIAIYDGCACDANGQPISNNGQPLCCSDDDCDLQSVVTCAVVCDQQYLIQIGQPPRNPPWPTGSGTFTVTTTGDPCGPQGCEISCPAGGIPEGEPGCGPGYVDLFNGGCSGPAPHRFSPIECGQTICGQSGTWDDPVPGVSHLDSDWYRLVLTECQRVSWCVEAEFPVQIELDREFAGAPPCTLTDSLEIARGPACTQVCITRELPAGVYYFIVSPDVSPVPCGAEYVARLGCAPCLNPGECDDCCAGAPRFTGFPGTVAVLTQESNQSSTFPILVDHVVDIIDITNQPLSALPLGLNWCGAAFYPAGPALRWRGADLGSVHGVALDDDGNAYVAHTSVYGNWQQPAPTDRLGTIAPTSAQAPGAIYKIDTSTGVASWFASLPNYVESAPASKFIVVPRPSGPTDDSQLYPGLGQIAFDCRSKSLYVSNFEDGRIYRISKAGLIQSSYDHATGAITPWSNAPPEPGDPHGWCALGERVWAVKVKQNRLYYSIWAEDAVVFWNGTPGSSNRLAPNYALANSVWSISLTPAGDFSGAPVLELTMPPFALSPPVSNPVADIDFDGECCMFLAERSMRDDTTSSAHDSRLLKFCRDANSVWQPTGSYVVSGVFPSSSAGGVAYDPIASPNTIAQIWATGDAIRLFGTLNDCAGGPSLYGLCGLPIGGGSPANSVLIDSEVDTTRVDKYQQGSVDVSCPKRCADIVDGTILCEVVGTPPALTGNYTYTFTFTNNTSPPVPIQFLFTPQSSGVTFNGSPPPGHSLALVNPVLPGATSPPITVTITGATPGEFCFDLTFGDPDINICCIREVCVDLPECDCVQFPECTITCIPGTSDYSMTFTAQNLFTPGPIDELHIFPLPIGSGVTASPADFYFPIVPLYGLTGSFTTVITGASPGQLCMRISIHLDGDPCCSEVKCVTLPVCQSPACGCDLNGDGVVDLVDLATLLAHFGTVTGALPSDGDSDGDGDVDIQDLAALLSYFGATCP